MKIRKSIRRIISLTAFALFFGGCGGIEPENRDYPLSLAWDYQEGSYTLIYGMAELSEMTEQQKGDENTPPGLMVQGGSLDELRAEYVKSQQYYLDLGHVQAVIFSQRLLEQPDAYGIVVEGMQKNPILGKNAYVFAVDAPEEVMKLGGQKEDTIGEYLTGIYENHMQTQKDGVTLEELYYDWNNEGKITSLPRLIAEKGQVVLCEEV